MKVGGGSPTWIHSFSSAPSETWAPQPLLIQSTPATLFGITSAGGPLGGGSVFSIQTDGGGFRTLHSFNPTSLLTAERALILGLDGLLYGTDSEEPSVGMVYRLHTDGTGFTILRDFVDPGSGECHPTSLIQGLDGRLYGCGSDRVDMGLGVVFTLNPDGTDYRRLAEFQWLDPMAPSTTNAVSVHLNQASTGVLFGMASTGTTNGGGFLFRLNADGKGFRRLHTFSGPPGDGANPVGGPLVLKDGSLAGLTQSGGVSNAGTAFQISADGSGYQIVHSFNGGMDGDHPDSGLTLAGDGTFYGIARAGSLFRFRPDGNTYATYANLRPDDRRPQDGHIPSGSLVRHPNGFLYGTCRQGGSHGSGTLFQILRDGTGYQNLHSFTTDEGSPPSGSSLLVGTSGHLYGNIGTNGPSTTARWVDFGVDGTSVDTLQTNFSGSHLLIGPDGSLYGLDSKGLFQSAIDGSHRTLLWSADRASNLALGLDGFLYVTAPSGNDSQWQIVRLQISGGNRTVFYEFKPGEGGESVSRLSQGADGTWYGTTDKGGSADAGTVFRLSGDGVHYEKLHEFDTNLSTSWGPVSGVVEGAPGILYGRTAVGPNPGVFRVRSNGTDFHWLQFFKGTSGDSDPLTTQFNWVMNDDGSFTGVTTQGGAVGAGSFFRIIPDARLNSPIELPSVWATNGMSFLFIVPGNVFNSLSGLPILRFDVDGLPPGLSFDAKHLAVTGVPTQTGLSVMRVTARTDCDSCYQTMLIRIQVAAPGGLYLISARMEGGRGVMIQGVGTPGAVYRMDRADRPDSGPWNGIGTTTAGDDGYFVFLDSSVTSSITAYYRAVAP